MTQSISRDHAASTSAASLKTSLRGRLLAARNTVDDATRAALAGRLTRLLERLAPTSLAFYWPMRGEPDLRQVVVDWLAGDPSRTAALPVMAEAGAPDALPLASPTQSPVQSPSPGPMAFHRWTPTSTMRTGRYGILVPEDQRRLHPAMLLIPCVGFNARGYRLGYGGGFYDRTLAALTPRPLTVGIALDCLRADDLPVEAHDLPLDGVLTETTGYGLASE